MEKRKLGKSINGKEMHYSVGVILKNGNKFLLLDRKNIPLGFACPAGHIDEGEEPRDAILREVFEETGIKLENVELLYEEEILWNKCRLNVSVHYWYLYKANVDSLEFVFDEKEAKSMNWYTVEEMKKLYFDPVWKYWFEKLKII